MQTMDTIERVVSADSASPNEDNIDRALRPTLLKDYVGQKNRLRSAADFHCCREKAS